MLFSDCQIEFSEVHICPYGLVFFVSSHFPGTPDVEDGDADEHSPESVLHIYRAALNPITPLLAKLLSYIPLIQRTIPLNNTGI